MKIYHLLLLAFVFFLFFGISFAEENPDYIIPAPSVSAEQVGYTNDTVGVQIFWEMPLAALLDAYGFIVEKQGPAGREQAANLYPADRGLEDLTDSGFYYDEAVAIGDTYIYYVKTYDRAGKESDWGQAIINIQGIQITDITVSDITSSSAKISWKTDVGTQGKVEYGLDTNYGSVSDATEYGLDHSQTISNLQANKSYHFRIKVYPPDEEDQAQYSPDRNFFAPLAISDVNIFRIAPRSATIEWNTGATPTLAKVDYCEDTFNSIYVECEYNRAIWVNEPKTNHSVTIPLTLDNEYKFLVRASSDNWQTSVILYSPPWDAADGLLSGTFRSPCEDIKPQLEATFGPDSVTFYWMSSGQTVFRSDLGGGIVWWNVTKKHTGWMAYDHANVPIRIDLRDTVASVGDRYRFAIRTNDENHTNYLRDPNGYRCGVFNGWTYWGEFIVPEVTQPTQVLYQYSNPVASPTPSPHGSPRFGPEIIQPDSTSSVSSSPMAQPAASQTLSSKTINFVKNSYQKLKQTPINPVVQFQKFEERFQINPVSFWQRFKDFFIKLFQRFKKAQ